MPTLELTDEQVLGLLQQLPEAQTKRIWERLEKSKSKKPRPQFGSGKADIVYMAEDFDAPLDDFKEYME